LTLNEYLAAEGLSPEEIAAIVGNEKQSKAMTKALGLAEEGKTLKAQAAAEKAETATFWEQKTQELQGSVQKLNATERRAAQAEAEAARVKAYNKSLADQGYDIPKEMYEGAPANPGAPPKDPASGQFLSREDFEKGSRKTGADLVSLTKLSNEYSYLKGEPYLSVDQDYEEARAAGKPLTEYARAKYKFDDLRAAKATAKSEADYKTRYEADLATEKAKWQLANGSNDGTRAPMPTKFDRMIKDGGVKSDSWKSPEGREANRRERLKKFENLSVQ
jgi:hypothetical protein